MPARGTPAPAVAQADDDMEFGGIPQAPAGSTGSPGLLPLPSPARVAPEELPAAAAPKPRARAAKAAAGLVALVAVSGASLEVLTPYGAFGRHMLLDLLNRDKFAAEQTSTIDGVRRLLASDTFSDANRALALVDAAHAKSPRATGLLAYGAFVGYAVELRQRSDLSSLAPSRSSSPSPSGSSRTSMWPYWQVKWSFSPKSRKKRWRALRAQQRSKAERHAHPSESRAQRRRSATTKR
jgi:hypothetical protein